MEMHKVLMQVASLVHEEGQQCTDGSMDGKGVAQQRGGCWGSSEESATNENTTANEGRIHWLYHVRNINHTHLANEVSQFGRHS